MIVQNRKLWVDAYDLSGHLQGMSFEASADLQDDTVFGDVARSNVPGLVDFSLQHEGVWLAGTGAPDAVFDTEKGLADVLATLTPVDGTLGAIAYFMRTTQGVYTPGGAVGELLRFSVSLSASGGIGAVRGTLMENSTKSSSGSSAAKRQLGAVSSSQRLFAGLHVLAVTGSSPTLDVTIRSDADSSGGGETTRITFPQMNAIGSRWATPVAGPITDTWWDVAWTVGGTGGPSFQIVVVVGIQ